MKNTKTTFLKKEIAKNFDPKNINWDDETVCNLCGKKEPCQCYDEFYCGCGLKNKVCVWPDGDNCKEET
jgi:hypothetical protein